MEGRWHAIGIAAAEDAVAEGAAGAAAAAGAGCAVAVLCERCMESLPRAVGTRLRPSTAAEAAAAAGADPPVDVHNDGVGANNGTEGEGVESSVWPLEWEDDDEADAIDGGRADGGLVGGRAHRSGWWGGNRFALDDGTGGFDGSDCLGGERGGALAGLPHFPGRGALAAAATEFHTAPHLGCVTDEHGGGVPSTATLAVHRRRVPLLPILENLPKGKRATTAAEEEEGARGAGGWVNGSAPRAILVLQCAQRCMQARVVLRRLRTARLKVARWFWHRDVWPAAAAAACRHVEARAMDAEHWAALALREEELQREEDVRLRNLVRDRIDMLSEDALTRLEMAAQFAAARKAKIKAAMAKEDAAREKAMEEREAAERVAAVERAEEEGFSHSAAEAQAGQAAALGGALAVKARIAEAEKAAEEAKKAEEEASKPKPPDARLLKRRLTLAAHSFQFEGWRQDRIAIRDGLELTEALTEDWEIHPAQYPLHTDPRGEDRERRSLPLRQFACQVVEAAGLGSRDAGIGEGGDASAAPSAYCRTYYCGVLVAETLVVPRSGAPVFPYADEAAYTLPSMLADAELLLELWDRRPEGDLEGEGSRADGNGGGGSGRKGSTQKVELTAEEEKAEEERRRLACKPGRGIGAGDHSLGCVRLRGVELLQFTNTTAAELARMGSRAPTAQDAKKATERLVAQEQWEGSALCRSACKGTPQPVVGKLSFKVWELTAAEDVTIPLDPHQRHHPNHDPVRRLSLAYAPPPLVRSNLTPQEVASSRSREWAKAGGPAFMKEKKAKARKAKSAEKEKDGGEAAPAAAEPAPGAGAAAAAAAVE